MKKLMYSLVLAALLCSTVFTGSAYARSNVSFGISFYQPAYVPVYVAPQPVYTCPQPVYVYPAPVYTYVPVQPGCTFGFSTFWGNRSGHAYHGGRGYYGGHRGGYGGWRGHR